MWPDHSTYAMPQSHITEMYVRSILMKTYLSKAQPWSLLLSVPNTRRGVVHMALWDIDNTWADDHKHWQNFILCWLIKNEQMTKTTGIYCWSFISLKQESILPPSQLGNAVYRCAVGMSPKTWKWSLYSNQGFFSG